jgi:hypothetical protein
LAPPNSDPIFASYTVARPRRNISYDTSRRRNGGKSIARRT